MEDGPVNVWYFLQLYWCNNIFISDFNATRKFEVDLGITNVGNNDSLVPPGDMTEKDKKDLLKVVEEAVRDQGGKTSRPGVRGWGGGSGGTYFGNPDI